MKEETVELWHRGLGTKWLMKRAHAMLIELGLPDEMWAELVMVTTNHIKTAHR